MDFNEYTVWLAVGFTAQGLFSARFFVQWIASERKKTSVIPLAFWFFSLAGGSLLLLYAIHRRDPVFIVGQGAGLVIYVRNLMLIYREKEGSSRSAELPKAPHQPRCEEQGNSRRVYSGSPAVRPAQGQGA